MQEVTTGDYLLNVTGEDHCDFLFKSNIFLISYKKNIQAEILLFQSLWWLVLLQDLRQVLSSCS